jgi:hypothetical protein
MSCQAWQATSGLPEVEICALGVIAEDLMSAFIRQRHVIVDLGEGRTTHLRTTQHGEKFE